MKETKHTNCPYCGANAWKKVKTIDEEYKQWNTLECCQCKARTSWHLGRAYTDLIPILKEAPNLLAALEEIESLVVQAQDILRDYLVPDGYDKATCIDKLLGLLDGPEQREKQRKSQAAITAAKGG